jgi:hypothetical protein
MERTIARVLSLSLVLLAFASPAQAQRAPDMATLDRGDGITKFGVDLGLTVLDGAVYDGALRLEPYGQYVLDSGFGFYGALPVTVSFGDEDDPVFGDQDDAALGNLDLGLLYVLDRPTVSWVFRGGVAVPTAADDLDGSLTNLAGVWPRFTDAALATPDATYIRLAVSPLVHTRKLFLRGDLGFDIGIGSNDTDPDELLRLNIGGGVDLGVVALSLELVTMVTLDDGDDEDFFHTFAFCARFMTKSLEPFLALGLPLDASTRDNVDLFVSGGIQVPFR